MTAAKLDHQLVGLPVADAATMLGLTRWLALCWLNKHGYHIRDGRVKKAELPDEIEQRIADRIAAAPPSAPCFRCGAARHCEHRPVARAA